MDAVTRLGHWLGNAAQAAGGRNGDWDLLRRAAAGHQPSAVLLVKTLTPQAYGLALRMLGRREDAEDAVQEAFLRLWRSSATDTQGARLSTYLNTIVLNCCRNLLAHRRAWGMDRADLADAHDVAAQPPAPTHAMAGLSASASQQRLDRGLQQLPARQRMALAMWAYADAPVADIARALEIDSNAAHQLLHRAKGAMRAYLEGETP